VKDQIGPLKLVGEGSGHKLRRLKPRGIRTPQRTAFRRALAQLTAKTVIGAYLGTDEGKPHQKTSAAQVGPLRRKLEGSAVHERTVSPVEHERQRDSSPQRRTVGHQNHPASPAQTALKFHAQKLGHSVHVVRSLEEFLAVADGTNGTHETDRRLA